MDLLVVMGRVPGRMLRTWHGACSESATGVQSRIDVAATPNVPRSRPSPVANDPGGALLNYRETVCRIALFALLIAGAGLPAAAAAPEGVSPGSTSRVAPVEVRCPTFNWGAVPGTSYYELVTYTLPPPDEYAAEEELILGEEVEVLFTTVPGSATGWTPPADRCLARGGRYVWFVRGVLTTEWDEAGEPGEWSDGLFFAVVASPGDVGGLEASTSADGAWFPPERRQEGTEKGDPHPDPWVLKTGDLMTGPLGVETDGLSLVSLVTRADESNGDVTKLEVRSDRGTPLLTVDSEGDLVATSLRGDTLETNQVRVGSTTVIDSTGSWVGSGSTVPCDECVTTADLADDAVTTWQIANGSVSSVDIADGTITAGDLANGSITQAKMSRPRSPTQRSPPRTSTTAPSPPRTSRRPEGCTRVERRSTR